MTTDESQEPVPMEAVQEREELLADSAPGTRVGKVQKADGGGSVIAAILQAASGVAGIEPGASIDETLAALEQQLPPGDLIAPCGARRDHWRPEAGAIYCAGNSHSRVGDDGSWNSMGLCPVFVGEQTRMMRDAEVKRLSR